MAHDLTDEEAAEIIADPTPWRFFEYLWIEHRADRRYIQFKDRGDEQNDWIRTLMEFPEAINLKGRNVGIGVATQAFHFWRAWRAAFHGVGIATLVVAHASDTAKRHLQRYKDYNARLPEKLRLQVANTSGGDNDTDYKLIVPRDEDDPSPEEYAWFRAVTSGGKKGQGRGFTQQQLHCTEFAFWGDGGRIDAGAVFGSLTSGMHDSPYKSIAVETTPNGMEGYFPSLYGKAKDAPDGGMAARFYPWTMQRSFVEPVPATFARTPEEEKLVILHGLTDGQLQWRRRKLEKLTIEKFQDDYPLTEAEAFRATATGYFAPESLTRHLLQFNGVTDWPKGWRVFSGPRPDRVYAVAVDVAAGVGKDDSVIQVIDNTFEQVACFSSNEVRPDVLGDMAVEVAIRYGNAKLMVESNNIGAETVARVRETGYPLSDRVLWGNARGNNRDEVFGYVKLQLDRNRVTLKDYHTVRDMLNMTITNRRSNNGKGGHNDHGMAMVYAIWMAKNLTSIDALRAREIQKRFRPANRLLSRYSA